MGTLPLPPPVHSSFELVRARSPYEYDETLVLLRDPEAWEDFKTSGKLSKLGQYLGLVHSGLERVDGAGLHGAQACFQGLMRPRWSKPLDDEICVYALNPGRDFTMVRSDGNKSLTLQDLTPPRSQVFVVLAEVPADPKDPRLALWRKISGSNVVRGLIHDWEWTIPGPDDDTLPAASRFKEQLWQARRRPHEHR
jgi:hypothetical protein